MKNYFRLFFLNILILIVEIPTSGNTAVDSLKQILQESVSDSLKIKIHYKIYQQLQYENINEARANALTCLEISKRIGYKKYEGKSLRALGILYHTQHNMDSSRFYILQALQIFEELHDTLFMGYLYNDIGSTYPQYSHSQIKLEYFKKSYAIIKQYNQLNNEAMLLHNIGLIYYRDQNFEQALDYFFKALELIEDNDLRPNELLYYVLGCYYERFMLYNKSKKMLNKSLNACKENNNRVYEYYNYNELVYLFLEQNKYDSARYYAQKTLLFKNDPFFKDFRNKVEFTWYYLKVDSLEKAYKYLTLSEKTDGYQRTDIKEYRNGSPIRLCHLLNKSLYYRKQKMPEKSLMVLLDIQEDSLSRFFDEYKYHLELSKVYSQLNNSKNAYKQQILANQWQDSLNAENNQQLIIEKDIAFKFEQEKQKQEAFLKQKNLITTLELNQKKKLNQILSLGIGFVLLTALIIYLNLKRKRRDNKLLLQQKEDIQQKEKLATTLFRELNHRVRNNLQMVSALFTIQLHNTNDNNVKNALTKASGRIDSLIVLHQHMYKYDYALTPNIKVYLSDLSRKIINAADINDKVKLKMHFDHIDCNIGQLTHIGLITNELITNAIKYGVNNERTDNLIELFLSKEKEKLTLIVKNTNFKEKKLTKKNNSTNFGLSLIDTIAQEYDGFVTSQFDSQAIVSVILYLKH